MGFQRNILAFRFLTVMLLFFLHSVTVCKSDSSQNIETFYHSPPPLLPPLPPPTPAPAAVLLPPPLQPPPPPPPPSSKRVLLTAIGVTAGCTLVAAAVLFFVCTRCTAAERKKGGSGRPERVNPYSAEATAAMRAAGAAAPAGFSRFDGKVKGMIIDEDGLDVLYWRKLEGSSDDHQKKKSSSSFNTDLINRQLKSYRKSFSRGKSSSSSTSTSNQAHNLTKNEQKNTLLDPKLSASDHISHSIELASVPVVSKPPLPPPPPPPVIVKRGPAPPPPPPPLGGGVGGGGPPALPKRPPAPPPPRPKRSVSGKGVELNVDDAAAESSDQVKLKPLHWEKVKVVDRDHSMVWDKVREGSFQYNGDMMEALFGDVAKNRKSPRRSPENENNATNPTSKITILDPRRSQNIAIVIRSLGISRKELIDGVLEGKGLDFETLEKLTRMSPTREEKLQILAFEGDVVKLADAESFLFHLLKAVPTAFTRVNAMLFRYTYESEVSSLKSSLRTLDSACDELRSCAVFWKLLEAILKAGNRLNVGTARGDAKAFNLTALHKLSDYKSTDGKTTLLHFVVHQVVRNEGRRCVVNSTPNLIESMSKEEQEKEFQRLGLPLLGGLSTQLSNVLRSAFIDYDTLSSISPTLASRVAETRQLVLQCGADAIGGEFIKEMKAFLEIADAEIKTVQEENARVMEYVKKTTQYYQSGAFKDKHPLQLFSIVKDFLDMVDKACVDITRSLQEKDSKKTGGNAGAGAGSGSGTGASSSGGTEPDVLRTKVTFRSLPDHFMSVNTDATDSDDDR